MAGDGANLAAGAARAAFDLSLSANTSGFSVSLRIDNPILAGIAVTAAVTLGVFYLKNKQSVENAVRNALEENSENGTDPEVRNIEEGSIIVELYCHTVRSLLKFVDDFETKKVKYRLEEEFTKIGLKGELPVIITNEEEVYKKVQEIRASLSSQEPNHAGQGRATQSRKSKPGYPEAPDGKPREVPQRFDTEKQETYSYQDMAIAAPTASSTKETGIVSAKHEVKLNIDIQKGKFQRQFEDAQIYVERKTLSPTKGLDDFLNRIEKTFGLITEELRFDCFKVGVTCPGETFERLEIAYNNGTLKNDAEKHLLAEEVKTKLKPKSVGIKTVLEKVELGKPEGDRAVIRLEVVTESLGAEKHNTSDRQFPAETNIFMKRDSFSQSKGVDEFLQLLKRKHSVDAWGLGFGCLEIRMKCPTSESLEKLLENHRSGKLDKIAKSCLITETQLQDVNLKTFITDDNNHPCSKSFPGVVKQSRGGAGPGYPEAPDGKPREVPHRFDTEKQETYSYQDMAIAAPTASSTKETGIVERLRQTIIIKSFLNLNDDAKVVEFDKYLAKRILMIKKERKKLPNKLPPDEDLCRLIGYLENEHKVSVIDARSGSLEIQVKPPTLESLESLKNDYCSGHLNEMAENFILTAEVREKLDLKDESLKTTIKRGDYLECRKFFLQAADAESDLSSQTDHSKSQAEGNGLKEADQGVEANFTITTRDSEGKQFYNEQEHVTVTIRSGARKEEVQTTDLKDGNYTVHYKPKSAGRLHVMIEINGWPLTGSPWRVKVKPHQYKVVKSCGSFGSGEGKFDTPRSIAKNEKTGEIAVGDMVNDLLQIFDENLKYLRSMGGKKASPTGAAVKIDCPASVAFLKNGDMIVIHGAISSRQMSLITDDGQFIQHFSKHVISPLSVVVTNDADDGHVIVCDGADNKIKVLSPDGAQLLQSIFASDYQEYHLCTFYHHDKYFVSYPSAKCVKVFNKKGEFLIDIGSEGSGKGQFLSPSGLVVDAFDNLIVCDGVNGKLKMFTQDGEFLCSFGHEIKLPCAITVCKNGDLLVTDIGNNCVLILR